MSLPSQAEYVIVGAGIHGLSTAWRLAERLTAAGESVEGRIVIIDKADRISAGATGIACGVVRNNYFQPNFRVRMNIMWYRILYMRFIKLRELSCVT